MNALQLRKLSPLARRERIATVRALSAPMTRIPMCGDPHLMAIDTLPGARAMLERRACQYAAWIAGRDREAFEVRRFNVWFDGSATVHFHDCHEGGETFAVILPAHVLAFDAGAPAIALPAPDADQAPPRCDHTAPLELAPPAAADRAPAVPAAKIDRAAPLRLAPTREAWRASQAREKAAREFEESRAARAARIAALPTSARRQIGAR